MLSYCKTSNDVVSSRKISKRKHLSGYHFNSEILSFKKNDFANEKREKKHLQQKDSRKFDTNNLTFYASNQQELQMLNFESSINILEENLIETNSEQSYFVINKDELKSL